MQQVSEITSKDLQIASPEYTRTNANTPASKVLQFFGRYRKPRARTIADFLDLKETVSAAHAAGLTVGAYIDRKHAQGLPGPTAQTIQGMATLGVFESPAPKRICEIGAGSGRYLDLVAAACHPTHYEIYETAEEWRDWLVEQYRRLKLVAQPCDGRTLAATTTASIDLVHCHKTFPALPFLVTISYFEEMARVVQSGGWVVFDVMTEPCFSPPQLKAWEDSGIVSGTWNWSPSIIPRELVVRFFADRDLDLKGSFFVPLWPGITECFVFHQKGKAA